MKVILSNDIISGNEEEAIRDGHYVRKPDGKLEITQKALKAYMAAIEKIERLSAIVKSALEQDATVEAGDFDAGVYTESAKSINWRAELVKAVSEEAAKKITAEAKKQDADRLRIHVTEEKQKGVRKSFAGAPVTEPVKTLETVEA